MIETAPAYRHCAEVARSRATNFYAGIRVLPPERRQAMCALYAFARRIDDIADAPGAGDDRMAQLEEQRQLLGRLAEADDDPVAVALDDAVTRFPIPISAFHDLIDGAEMDVEGARYEDFSDLEVYCRRVAGSIGRLSLSLFVCEQDEAAERRADDLGVALQLTNILRDVREDLANGRVYLPRRDLAAFGCRPAGERLAGDVEGLIHFEARRARGWFERGMGLVPLLDRRSAICVGVMAGIYRRLLERIDGHPDVVLRKRATLPGWEKGLVAVRVLSGVGR
jgi:15-cis-phytoene synthase